MQEHDGCPIVAGLLEKCPGLLEIRGEKAVHALLRGERGATAKQRATRPVVRGVAYDRLGEVLLVERVPQRSPHSRVVEGLCQMVRPEHVLIAEWVPVPQFYVRIGFQNW